MSEILETKRVIRTFESGEHTLEIITAEDGLATVIMRIKGLGKPMNVTVTRDTHETLKDLRDLINILDKQVTYQD